MAQFLITAPDGKKYKITGDTQEGALAALKKHLAASNSSTTEDMAKSGASGFARGTAQLLGLPGTISDFIDKSTDKAWNAVTGQNVDTMAQRQKIMGYGGNPLSGQRIQQGMANVTGGATEYQPKTVPGEYAATTGEFLPGAMVGGGGSVGNVLKYGVAPAVTSETAGQLTKGLGVEPYARVAGALAAPFGVTAARKAVTPFPASAERLANAKVLQKEGVPVTGGQKVGSEALQYQESMLGGGAAKKAMETQTEAFTRAALKRIGVDAPRATPEVMKTAQKTIGNQFDDATRGFAIGRDRTLAQSVGRIVGNAKLDMSAVPARVEEIGRRIVKDMQQPGGITSERYQRLSHELADYAYKARSDSGLRDVYYAMRDALDTAMEKSISASGNTASLGAMKVARKNWANYKTIEKVASRAGDATEGLISPAALRQAVSSGSGKAGYVTGQGDFADLARAGANILRPLPDSGTPGRLMGAMGGPSMVRAGAGGAIAQSMGIPAPIGAAAGYVLPPMAGRAMLSGPGRAYLGNQLLAPGTTKLPLLSAAAPGLLAGPR